MSRPDSICPRCGYSLVGEVTSWIKSCPLDGRCAECGLAFAWPDVFDPDRQGPRWCIEFASGRTLATHGLVLLRALLSTWGRALWPWTFFRQIELTHRVRPWRLTLYACSVLVLAYIGFSLAQGYVVWGRFRNWGLTAPQIAWRTARTVLLPLSDDGWRYIEDTPERWLWPLWYLLATIILPFTFILLRTSMREARIRRGHLARVTVYNFSWFVVIVILIGLPVYLVAAFGLWRLRGSLLLDFAVNGTRWAGPIFLAVPWWIATRRYLRMRHALGVAVAMTVLAVLLSFIVVYRLFHGMMLEILFW